ncbi:metallophosphoesterase [Chitinophaga sp. CC14]|uniref:metallophosphoesterase n=1 Tax=Chitinophaga sp. CC14 TaxID=3029199 RepID=UPI003B7A2F08
MMRTFVMGDIHGGYKALLQCLDRSGFNEQCDRLIQLGDVPDGYPQVYECVEELLKIRYLVPLKGNHDDWFNEFAHTDFHPYYWNHGGKGTLISYLEHAGKKGRYFTSGSGYKSALESTDIPETHKAFFSNQKPWYIDEHQRCFVHAGFDRRQPFLDQRVENYYWDRSLWEEACQQRDRMASAFIPSTFSEIYIGHTPTTRSGTDQPLQAFHIRNIDTGAGHAGRLTIMDIDSKAFWQSDPLPTLYPENFG